MSKQPTLPAESHSRFPFGQVVRTKYSTHTFCRGIYRATTHNVCHLLGLYWSLPLPTLENNLAGILLWQYAQKRPGWGPWGRLAVCVSIFLDHRYLFSQKASPICPRGWTIGPAARIFVLIRLILCYF